jgi:hypothetical protein
LKDKAQKKKQLNSKSNGKQWRWWFVKTIDRELVEKGKEVARGVGKSPERTAA